MLLTEQWQSLDLKDIAAISMVLFAVIDVVGAIPVIIVMRKQYGTIQSGKATIAALIILIVFLFLGQKILEVIGIRVTDFAIAGSFVIFCVALEMILGIRLYKTEIPEIASIVPLAFPLIAGAGTMTTLLSLRAQHAVINIIIAICLNMMLVYCVLKTTKKIERVLGPGGVEVLRRVFGIILLAIAVKLFRTNVGI